MQPQNGDFFMAGFVARLKELRGTMTQADFSKKIGIKSYKTYQHYESGRRTPNIEFIIQVAKSCGVSSDYLLGLAEQNGERISTPVPNGDFVLQKAEAIISSAEKMKKFLGDSIQELKDVL